MDAKLISKVVENSENFLREAKNYTYKRELFYEIKKIMNEKVMIGIKGLRGVGKTTLIAQLAGEEKSSIYVDLSKSYLITADFEELIRELREIGYRKFFIDEIHEKKNWDYVLKTLYDEYKDIKIVFTGSSIISLDKGRIKADLARRAKIFELPPLSFREYLAYRKNNKTNKISLKELGEKSKLLNIKLISNEKYFREYLEKGGLMYNIEDEELYYELVLESIKRTVEKDLSIEESLTIKEREDIYAILYYIAKNPSYEVNKESIANDMGLSQREVQKLIDILIRSGLVYAVYGCNLRKRKGTPKLYLPIPLRNALLDGKAEIGALREDFFVQHVIYSKNIICYPKGERKKADFVINKKIYEIGGKSKGKAQKANYYVLETTEVKEKVIPLYLIGFLY